MVQPGEVVPYQVLSVMIEKEDLVNFFGDLEEVFVDKIIVIRGTIWKLGGKPVSRC